MIPICSINVLYQELIIVLTLDYVVRKIFFILQSIWIIAVKVEKQGQSTIADILVDNLIPNSVHPLEYLQVYM